MPKKAIDLQAIRQAEERLKKLLEEHPELRDPARQEALAEWLTTLEEDYTSYKVANFLVEFSTSIPRTQLRPSYGDGFLGAPLQSRQPLENLAPREQGDQRGSSSTQRQQNSGGAHHI